jgi:hypothetical protein
VKREREREGASIATLLYKHHIYLLHNLVLI